MRDVYQCEKDWPAGQPVRENQKSHEKNDD